MLEKALIVSDFQISLQNEKKMRYVIELWMTDPRYKHEYLEQLS